MSPPLPVYGPDTLLAELGTAEILLAVSLRLFALPWQEPGRDHPDWRKGLAVGRLPPWTANAFEALFGVVIAATRRPLDVRCLDCPRLGYDEARLLQIVSLLQHRRIAEAEAVLETWLPDAARRFALSPAAALARALRQADLVVPLRHAIAPNLPAHQLSTNPGLALLQ